MTSHVNYSRLGKSGLVISNVCLGSSQWLERPTTTATENVEQKEVVAKTDTGLTKQIGDDVAARNNIFSVIKKAYEGGINFFDVSTDAMTNRKSERLFGSFLRSETFGRNWPRQNFVVACRVHWGARNEPRNMLSRKVIVDSVNESLQNLGLEYIDLLIIQKLDQFCPVQEIARTCDTLMRNGKILYWATAGWTPVELSEAINIARLNGIDSPLCDISEYHIFHRQKVELYMSELYNKVGVGLVTWSPFSLGYCPEGEDDTTKALHLLTNLILKDQNQDVTLNNNCDHCCTGRTNIEKMCETLEDKCKELGFENISQFLVAWSVSNHSSQSVVISANSVESLQSQLSAVQQSYKLNTNVLEKIESIVNNKPIRQQTISTLQQRWAKDSLPSISN